MLKNFDIDARRIVSIIDKNDTEIQIGLLNGMIDQTINHHVVESDDNDQYDKLILRGGKILDKYDPPYKKPLLEKVADLLYLDHEDSRKFFQNKVDSEVAFLPAISTFKTNIIDFTKLAPPVPVVEEAAAPAA